MSTIPFTYKNCPVTPGAYMVNSNYGSFPIFCSIPNYQTLGMTNGSSGCDNYYIIMPGYSIYVYTSTNYGGSVWSWYNENSYPVIQTTGYIDRGLSCKLFIGGNKDTGTEISSSYIIAG